MQALKVVGKSGQITLGKALAGMGFVMHTLPGGDILLKNSVVVPAGERWVHEPAMKGKLAHADKWMRKNPPGETNLDRLEAKASKSS